MGQAKNRGTFEERKAAAIAREEQLALERHLESRSRALRAAYGRPAPVTRPGRLGSNQTILAIALASSVLIEQ